MLLLESVPNFSEGRDEATIAAIGEVLAAHARVLDVHSDADHNRSVFTVVGTDDELVEALIAAVEVARDRIDLRPHAGAHPRIGAADVVPVVPIVPGDMARARAVARVLGERVGELGLPVFVYAPPERGPAFYRRGGVEELQRRIDAGDVTPDFGPRTLHPSAGGVIVGARAPLIALNVNLGGSTISSEVTVLEAAKQIAGDIRESPSGGFPGVRALGLDLPSRDMVQVSMNIEAWEAAPIASIVSRIRHEASALGLEVVDVELVGLLPQGAAAAAAAEGLEFDDSRILELRLPPELG